jgi:hypothetical protein
MPIKYNITRIKRSLSEDIFRLAASAINQFLNIQAPIVYIKIGGKMAKKNYIVVLPAFFLFLCLCSPAPRTNLVTTMSSRATTLDDLKIGNNDMQEWFLFASLDKPDSFTVYPPAEWSRITGEQQRPAKLLDFAIEHMAGPGSNELTALFSNMGTIAFASTLYRTTIAPIINRTGIPDFDQNVAVGVPDSHGIEAIAHFNKFVIRLKFHGFDSQAQAAAKASQFLTLLQGKSR